MSLWMSVQVMMVGFESNEVTKLVMFEFFFLILTAVVIMNNGTVEVFIDELGSFDIVICNQ
jgi:hypothetical protein